MTENIKDKVMTQEEKSKAYDEAREKIALRFGSNVADEIFSQFEMSDDERIRKELIRMVEEDWPGRGDVIAWLEKQGEKETNGNDGEVPFLAWNEEDEKIVLSIEQVMNCASLLNIVPEKIDKIRTWLKSIKDRVRPKTEWSEQDNINCNRLLYLLNGGNLMQDHKIELFVWFQSIKDRYTWKPSDEQMETLKFACGGNYVDLGVLELLYQDLKKLREE